MNWSLIIKIVIFIILAVFASWPYFEKFKDYRWTKRLWIGIPIFLLLVLGTIDLCASDTQAKSDKKENTKLTDTISALSARTTILNRTVSQLMNKIDNLKKDQQNTNDKQDYRDQKENERDIKIDRLTLLIHENAGNISESVEELTNQKANEVLQKIADLRKRDTITDKTILYYITDDSNLRTFTTQLRTLLKKNAFIMLGPDAYHESFEGINISPVKGFYTDRKIMQIIIGSSLIKGEIPIN